MTNAFSQPCSIAQSAITYARTSLVHDGQTTAIPWKTATKKSFSVDDTTAAAATTRGPRTARRPGPQRGRMAIRAHRRQQCRRISPRHRGITKSPCFHQAPARLPLIGDGDDWRVLPTAVTMSPTFMAVSTSRRQSERCRFHLGHRRLCHWSAQRRSRSRSLTRRSARSPSDCC